MSRYNERNTLEGVRNWLQAVLSTPGWRSSSITKGLLSADNNTMPIIIKNYNKFTTQMKQSIVLSVLHMEKKDFLWSMDDEFIKFMELARVDSDEFVRTMANMLIDYPSSQTIDLSIDNWSDDFNSLVKHIGEAIPQQGVNFHPMEDMLLHPSARNLPSNVSSNNYNRYTLTRSQQFNLTTDPEDFISTDEERHAIFRDLIEKEEAEEQVAQAAAKKKADAQLRYRRSILSPDCSSFSQASSSSTTDAPGTSALFTKRPARPILPSTGDPFIEKKRPLQMTGDDVPRGLQRTIKTQMLDFHQAEQLQKEATEATRKAKEESRKKRN